MIDVGIRDLRVGQHQFDAVPGCRMMFFSSSAGGFGRAGGFAGPIAPALTGASFWRPRPARGLPPARAARRREAGV